ncbi:MAG: hypothetical protein WBZ36_04715 [Candidatus Nitrosopolaris sp.]
MKSIDDAMILRNHVINMLEQADVESENKELKTSLITFVVVGGGFFGVETFKSVFLIQMKIQAKFDMGFILFTENAA